MQNIKDTGVRLYIRSGYADWSRWFLNSVECNRNYHSAWRNSAVGLLCLHLGLVITLCCVHLASQYELFSAPQDGGKDPTTRVSTRTRRASCLFATPALHSHRIVILHSPHIHHEGLGTHHRFQGYIWCSYFSNITHQENVRPSGHGFRWNIRDHF